MRCRAPRRPTWLGRSGPDDVRLLIDDIVRSSRPELAAAWARVLGELPRSGVVPEWGWPDYAPAHGPALQLDDEGNLRVVEYGMPGETGNTRTVISREGVWLGSVELPLGFSPSHIGPDFVLGVWRDELEVEHVRLYGLVKP